jgi:hypothetical protein
MLKMCRPDIHPPGSTAAEGGIDRGMANRRNRGGRNLNGSGVLESKAPGAVARFIFSKCRNSRQLSFIGAHKASSIEAIGDRGALPRSGSS